MPLTADAATKSRRELFVGNTPANTTERGLADHLNAALRAAGFCTAPGAPVISCRVSAAYAFVELRSVQETDNCLSLTGLPFLGGALKIGRPTKYDGPRTVASSWARVAQTIDAASLAERKSNFAVRRPRLHHDPPAIDATSLLCSTARRHGSRAARLSQHALRRRREVTGSRMLVCVRPAHRLMCAQVSGRGDAVPAPGRRRRPRRRGRAGLSRGPDRQRARRDDGGVAACVPRPRAPAGGRRRGGGRAPRVAAPLGPARVRRRAERRRGPGAPRVRRHLLPRDAPPREAPVKVRGDRPPRGGARVGRRRRGLCAGRLR